MITSGRCAFGRQLLLALALQIFSRPHSTSTQEKRWYKGNTHTHTVNSDGDSTPDEVVRWYREYGYNFLVLSDHNYLTEVDGLNAVFGAQGKFIVIRGEEVSDKFQEKPIHLNGLNIKQVVEPQGGASVSGVIQNNVNAIRKVEGAPHVNHPNFHWAVGANDLKTIKNLRLFEVYNGHPQVNNLGGGGMPDSKRCGTTSFRRAWSFTASRWTTLTISRPPATRRNQLQATDG